MKKHRIVIVDDHRLFREGIAEICENEPDLEIVGQADSGSSALAIVRQENPDVVLLDVEMPDTDVHDVLRRLLSCQPTLGVAILTMHDDARLVNKLMSLGARAYISKGVTRQELLVAIRSIRKNKDHVVLSISRNTMDRLDKPSEGPLTTREFEVLHLVSRGLRNAQIASQLYISEGTVKRHLTNIYQKLGVPSRISAVNKAAELGLLEGGRN